MHGAVQCKYVYTCEVTEYVYPSSEVQAKKNKIVEPARGVSSLKSSNS